MNKTKWIVLVAVVLLGTTGARFVTRFLNQPVYVPRTAGQAAAGEGPENVAAEGAQPGEHPLDPALKMARACLNNIETNVKNYSATLVKRERVDGKLTEPESMLLKVRHEPFSVYAYFSSPDNLKGQEVAFVEGKNSGNMQAHGVGLQGLIGVVSLAPDGRVAMYGQRYPITEIGILNLTKRLIEAAEQGRQHGECEVTIRAGAQIDGRACTCIEVVHPTQRPYFNFCKALVYIDDEMNIPVSYEAYEWPDTPGGEPKLIEQYTYVDVELNNDFTDADFELK